MRTRSSVASANPLPARSPPVEVPKQALTLTLSSGAVFAASLIVQLVGVVGSTILLKTLGLTTAGAAIIGTVQLFLLIGSSINGVGDLRLGTAYTYFLARGKPPTDNTTAYFLVRTAMVASAGAVLFIIAPLSVGGYQIVQGNEQLTSFGLFAFLPILWSFSTVYNQMFVGRGNSLKAQYPSLVEAVVRLPFLFYVAYHAPTVEGITLAYVAGAAASAMFSLPAVAGQMRRFRPSEAVRLFRFAWPLMASLLLNYLVTNTVPLIVGADLGHVQLSVFLIANGWRILVLSLPAAVATPLFPYLAGLHRQERYEALRRGTWQALRYAALLMMPGVVALVTYRYTFLRVVGSAIYAGPGAFPLALLVVGALPLALSQIIQTSINAIGRQRLELYITITQMAVLFTAMGLVLPHGSPLAISNGLVAGSVAILASSIAALALNTYFMEKLIRVHIHPRSILSIAGAAAGSFAVLSLVNRIHLFSVASWYQLMAAVVIGFVVYFFLLALIGELTREDVRRIGYSMSIPRAVVEAFARIPWRERTPDLPPIDLRRAPGLQSTELPEPFTGVRELPEIAPEGTDAPLENGDGRTP